MKGRREVPEGGGIADRLVKVRKRHASPQGRSKKKFRSKARLRAWGKKPTAKKKKKKKKKKKRKNQVEKNKKKKTTHPFTQKKKKPKNKQ